MMFTADGMTTCLYMMCSVTVDSYGAASCILCKVGSIVSMQSHITCKHEHLHRPLLIKIARHALCSCASKFAQQLQKLQITEHVAKSLSNKQSHLKPSS